MPNIIEITPDTPFPEPLLNQFRQARAITVLTGAGISAESGVPTFRDAQTGLWAKFRPEELANPQAFLANPKLVWDWYAWRRKLVSDVGPNPGHYALSTLAHHVERFSLITQNVDSLHQKAGSPEVIELHGNIGRIICFDCARIVAEAEAEPPIDTGKAQGVPRCPYCDGLLRPDVIWFGERLPEKALNQALSAATECDLFLSIGTSGLVHPAASLPSIAQELGVMTIEVNPSHTMLTDQMDYVLRGPSGAVLPQLLTALNISS